jgi:hypothetical protein
MVIGLDLPTGTPLSEKEIAGAESAVIFPQIPTIATAGLKAGAIEQFATTLHRSVNQKEIVAPKPDNRSLFQIFGTGGLGNAIKLEGSRRRSAGDREANLLLLAL